MKLLAIASTLTLITACFFPWVEIESKGLVLTGLDALNFKKPGYLHFFFSGLYLLFLFINKGWSQKAAVFVTAFNIAWAIRNFVLISACHMGDCPAKKIAIYLLIPSSVLMLVAALFWELGGEKRK